MGYSAREGSLLNVNSDTVLGAAGLTLDLPGDDGVVYAEIACPDKYAELLAFRKELGIMRDREFQMRTEVNVEVEGEAGTSPAPSVFGTLSTNIVLNADGYMVGIEMKCARADLYLSYLCRSISSSFSVEFPSDCEYVRLVLYDELDYGHIIGHSSLTIDTAVFYSPFSQSVANRAQQ